MFYRWRNQWQAPPFLLIQALLIPKLEELLENRDRNANATKLRRWKIHNVLSRKQLYDNQIVNEEDWNSFGVHLFNLLSAGWTDHHRMTFKNSHNIHINIFYHFVISSRRPLLLKLLLEILWVKHPDQATNRQT